MGVVNALDIGDNDLEPKKYRCRTYIPAATDGTGLRLKDDGVSSLVARMTGNSPFQQTSRKGGQIDQGRAGVYPVSQESLPHAVAE
jgi:hypothetical protein